MRKSPEYKLKWLKSENQRITFCENILRSHLNTIIMNSSIYTDYFCLYYLPSYVIPYLQKKKRFINQIFCGSIIISVIRVFKIQRIFVSIQMLKWQWRHFTFYHGMQNQYWKSKSIPNPCVTCVLYLWRN